MKIKALIGLATICAIGLFGCRLAPAPTATPKSPEAAQKFEKSLQGNWVPATNTVFRSDGTTFQAKSRKSIWHVDVGNHPAMYATRSVIAFFDPKTRKLFVGLESDLYIEANGRIFGGEIVPGGELRWHDSFVSELKTGGLNAAIVEFAKTTDNLRLVYDFESFTKVGGPVDTSSWPQWAIVHIDQVEVRGNELKLDVVIRSAHSKATVWIDLDTRKIVRAVTDGKQTYSPHLKDSQESNTQ